MIRRLSSPIESIPEDCTSQNIEILVGDNCFMERCGDKLQGYWRLPNAVFSSSDETLLKMPADWVVPHVYRSYKVVRWSQPRQLGVWYQEGSQGICRYEEVLVTDLGLI